MSEPLEIKVTQSGVDTATSALGRLIAEGKRADTVTTALGKHASDAAIGWRTLDTTLATISTQLDKTGRSATAAAGAMKGGAGGLGSTLKELAGPMIGLVSATAALSKLVNVSREFDKLNAGLITSTGSAQNAAEAFEILQGFAAKTPYSLSQATAAFTKLVNYGLTPSERAMTSYGNTSAALGKGLDQMIEAVADAATGEFERLKEFGIKAAQHGDKVTFTFRGVATTVKKNTDEIEGYLMRLGENNFGNAMSERMKTLDGALSNLGDQWDKTFLQMGQGNLGGLVKDSVATATDALAGFVSFVESDFAVDMVANLQGAFTSIAYGFDLLITKISGSEAAMSGLKDAYKRSVTDILVEQAGKKNDREWQDSMRENAAALREQEKAFAELQKRAKAGLVDKDTLSAAEEHVKMFRLNSIAAIDATKAVGKAEEALAGVYASSKEKIAALVAGGADPKSAAAEIKRQNDAAKADLAMAQATYDAVVNTDQGADPLAKHKKAGSGKAGPSQAEITAEKQRRAQFDKLAEDLQGETGRLDHIYNDRQKLIDRYAKGELKQTLTEENARQYVTGMGKLAEAETKEIDDLKNSMRKDGEILLDEYNRRKKIIENGTTAGSPQEVELSARATKDYNKGVADIAEAKRRERAQLGNEYQNEREQLIAAQDEKRREILRNEDLTEQQRFELLNKWRIKTAKVVKEYDDKRAETAMASASALAGNLANVAKNFAGEQSASYKALFAISKAFSVAQGTIAVATGTANALSLGWPEGLFAMLEVAAQGAKVLATITSTNFSGAYDNGGNIPAGGVGIVGEKGWEFVHGPASVTSRRDTEKILQSAANPQGQQPIQLRVISGVDQDVTLGHIGSEAGTRVVMHMIKKNANVIRELIG